MTDKAVSNIRFKAGKLAAGFTLIELMATLAVGGLLISFAVPSFNEMLQNNRISSQANDFVTAMNLARSEAIKRKVSVNVTATNAADPSSEWGQGWEVKIDGGASLRVYPALSGPVKLNSINSKSSFQYIASGRINSPDTITLCDNRVGETGRLIMVAATGRVNISNMPCT